MLHFCYDFFYSLDYEAIEDSSGLMVVKSKYDILKEDLWQTQNKKAALIEVWQKF